MRGRAELANERALQALSSWTANQRERTRTRRRGVDDWLRGDIAGVIGEELLERLLSGSVTHAERRHDEMLAAAAYLDELGVEPRVAHAAAGWLEQLAGEKRARRR